MKAGSPELMGLLLQTAVERLTGRNSVNSSAFPKTFQKSDKLCRRNEFLNLICDFA